MQPGLIDVAGGLGLFLLGMSIMTGGLKSLASDRLRHILASSTRSPGTGVITGALTTALIQSSSATTVAAVGFVDAGLLTFSEAIGIIFGANIGTTITGWLVALVGFKLKLGRAVLPVILIGVMVRLLGRRRWPAVGSALSGFGLIFVGIGLLQEGMSAFEGLVTPSVFPDNTFFGRLLLVVIGIAITVVMQSSSAGVATAMVALHAGSITLPQAAAMVIGMDLGTTLTAVLATLGGGIQARRTGFAHVVYNVLSASVAFFLLTPFLYLSQWLLPQSVSDNPEMILVAFHTTFNILVVFGVLPFTSQFAAFLTRLFPDAEEPLVRRLDPGLLKAADPAMDVVDATIRDIAREVLTVLNRCLSRPDATIDNERLSHFSDAISQTTAYVHAIQLRSDGAATLQTLVRSVHVLDHLNRLLRRLRDSKRHDSVRSSDNDLASLVSILIQMTQGLLESELLVDPVLAEIEKESNESITHQAREYRRQVIAQAIDNELGFKDAQKRMDAARWLRRIGYHLWRIAHHREGEVPLSQP